MSLPVHFRIRHRTNMSGLAAQDSRISTGKLGGLLLLGKEQERSRSNFAILIIVLERPFSLRAVDPV